MKAPRAVARRCVPVPSCRFIRTRHPAAPARQPGKHPATPRQPEKTRPGNTRQPGNQYQGSNDAGLSPCVRPEH